MDSDLMDFISHLDDDVPFSPYPQLNEIWRELEDYFDQSYFNIDEFLDELLPSAQPPSSAMQYDIPPTNEPQLMTEEKLFQSFAIPESFFKDLIVDPPPVKGQNVVTNEILLNSVRSLNYSYSGRKYEHPLKDLISTRVSSAAPLRKDYGNMVQTKTTLKPSMSPNQEWYSVLHKQQLHPDMTAEAMAENLLHDESVVLPPRTEIVGVIRTLFTDLNSYIDRLSLKFDANKFFDSPQLAETAQKLQQRILLQSNVTVEPLRDVLLHWMGLVTESFAHINDQRRDIEEKVSGKVIIEAVEIYRRRLLALNLNEDNGSTSYEREIDIICQGIRHAYANCGRTFTAQVVSQLRMRLQNESLTTRKPRISRMKSLISEEHQVMIDLFVSEYASSINQKGIQCAGISTLKQFDDVNATCLKDAWHNFDRRTNGLPVDGVNELKKQLRSKLDSESDCKRSDFKSSLKASASSTVSFGNTSTRSVGIHFGFETFSISYYDRAGNSFRTIFGPVANVISLTSDGISIGLIPSDGHCLNMETLLTNLKVDRFYDAKQYGRMKIESIVALMLMYIDEMAKQSLHATSNIQYTMAIPSCLNKVMQKMFSTAINIAEIDCQLIQEQCALTTVFIRENHQVVNRNNDEYVVAMVVNEKTSCDSVVCGITSHEHKGKMIEVLSASGSADNRKWGGIIGNTGVQYELDKIQSKCNRRIRFIVVCSNRQEICKLIKNQFRKSKVYSFKPDSIRLAEGAALLSHLGTYGNSNLEWSFDLRNLTSIKPSGSSYRLVHTSSNSNTQDSREVSAELRSILDFQLKQLSDSKAAAKQIIVGKMKDLEESRLKECEKKKFRQSLKNDLKAVDDELMNKRVVGNIAENWRKKQF